VQARRRLRQNLALRGATAVGTIYRVELGGIGVVWFDFNWLFPRRLQGLQLLVALLELSL
jgi:hypothetical protein